MKIKLSNKDHLLGKPQKKVFLLMAGPLRGRGRVKGRTIKEKRTFFRTFFFQRSKISTAIVLEGEGGLGLNGHAIKRRTFFAASLLFIS